MKTFFIGELADKFGLNPRTIRYYERIGLLAKAARSESGYRLYTPDAVERLEFILKAKTLGLTLEEVRRILSLHDEGSVPCEHTRAFVRRKVQEADEKIAALQALKKTLSKALKSKFRKHAASYCPIIEGAGTKWRKTHMKRQIIAGVAAVFSSLPAFAHGPGEGAGAGMMGPGMMGWGYGMGWFWPILMAVFWVAVIVGIIFLVRWLIVSTRIREHGRFEESALDILKKRYVRGEITKDEFEKMKKDIGE